jgi:hypothetical protein
MVTEIDITPQCDCLRLPHRNRFYRIDCLQPAAEAASKVLPRKRFFIRNHYENS